MFNNSSNENLVEYVVLVNKCTKVVKGGKNLSFAVLVVVGDKKGRIGYGVGKAREVVSARNKAFTNAKKKLWKVPLKESRTLHHDVSADFCTCKVVIRSAAPGTGIIAGPVVRNVLYSLGLKDVVAKVIGSSNPYNVIVAVFRALLSCNSPKSIADRRGKSVSEVIKRRNILLSSNSNVVNSNV